MQAGNRGYVNENLTEHPWNPALPACRSKVEVNNIFPLFSAPTVISLEEQTSLQ